MTNNVITPKEANKLLCCQGGASGETCVADRCMAWRWLPLMTDEPGFLDAIKQKKEELQKKDKRLPQAAHNAAAKYVNENRKEFGLRTEVYQGFCGLAGSWKVT